MIEKLLAANTLFTKRGILTAPKRPRCRVAILTCMDCHLVDLVEPALGISRGDAVMLKSAGHILEEGMVRSLVVAIYHLGVEEVVVLGHRDCGMAGLDTDALRREMVARGVREEVVNGRLELGKWLGCFDDEEENVRTVVKQIRRNPFITPDIKVHGLLMDPDTGKVEMVAEDYCCPGPSLRR